MIKKKTYKPLGELVKQIDERAPLSTRVKKETKAFLNRESKSRKVKVSSIAAAILDDYVQNCPDKDGGSNG